MHNDAALGKLEAQFVKRQITLLSHTFTEPRTLVAQLAATNMTLSSRRQRARLTLQDNKVIHKSRRHPEMTRRLAMGVPLFNERNNTGTQLDRM
ncbi:hypothetical protein ATY81_26560 [Rhizobium sp. R72]|nr:hypothetical protein ATY81_26560 [Rhizobium sp. R72]OWV98959.1 hypothetical protein ATY80_26560 [Rhizobium sp. R711]